MLGTTVQDAQQDGWLTIAEAAAVLSTSPDTVRRRIRRGELVAQRRARQVRVRLNGVHGSVHSTDGVHGSAVQGAVQEQSEGLLEALRMIDRLQRENRDLAGLVGQLQERVATLQAQLALPEPSPDALQRDSDKVPVETSQQPPERTRPWWRFW